MPTGQLCPLDSFAHWTVLLTGQFCPSDSFGHWTVLPPDSFGHRTILPTGQFCPLDSFAHRTVLPTGRFCEDGSCSAEIGVRIASAAATMARLNRIWRSSTTSFASNSSVLSPPFSSMAMKHGPGLLTQKKKKKKKKGSRLSKSSA